MEYRYRVINRTGTAAACGLNVADYDPEQEGVYTTLNGSLSGRWVFNYPPGSEPIVLKTCSGSRTISRSGFLVPPPMVEFCEGEEESSFDCDPPPPEDCYVGFTYLCGFEEGETAWSASGPVNSGTAAGKAYGSAQRTYPGEWSGWVQGTVGGWAGLGATDSRVATGCTQTNNTLELEFRGRIIPTLIRWQDQVTPSGGGTPSYTSRELLITGPGSVSIDWIAGPSTAVVAGNLAIWLPG
jgi:hypothetical protein